MGLGNKLKSMVGGGKEGEDSEADEIGSQFADEIESETEEVEEFEEWDDEEEVEETWDNPYRFAEDILEPDGFANLMDFARKAAFHEVSRSPQFRDRIKHGSETMQMVSRSLKELEDVKGGKDKDTLRETADKLEDANRVIDAADKMSGREDMIVNEALGLGRDMVEVLGTKAASPGGDVDSNVRDTNREF